jgi:dienelactone hydrolase
MSFLEGGILAAAILGLLAVRLGAHERIGRLVAVIGTTAASLLLIGYLLAGHFRWQMWPAALVVVILVLLTIRNTSRRAEPGEPSAPRPPRRLKRWAANALLILVGAVAVSLPMLFPLDFLPRPTGTYAVGTTRFNLRDETRPEVFTADPADRRELEVVTWYPAADAKKPIAPFWGNPVLIGSELSKSLGLPGFFFSHVKHVRSHAHLDAEVAGPARFPILLFSHGYGSFAGQSSALFEDLASHGYIVLAINHPHEGVATTLSSGRPVTFDRKNIEAFGSDYNRSAAAMKRASDASNPVTAEQGLRDAIGQMPTIERSLKTWASDIEFVRQAVSSGATSGSLRAVAGAADFDRLGVVGMSFGAAAAMEMCSSTGACKAVVNLDGSPISRSALSGTPAPVLFLVSDSAPNNRMNMPFFRRAGSGSVYALLKGSLHYDYSDLSLVSPIFRWLGIVGPIGGERATVATRTTVRAFLDQHLKPGKAPAEPQNADVEVLSRR